MGKVKCVLFDWGNTLMREMESYEGPMHKWPVVEAMPGALESITRISADRILALATNAMDSGEEEIWKALARVEFDTLINKVYCFRKVGMLKPSRGFFDFILGDLKLTAKDAMMVGDSFPNDVMGAVRCGIYSIWLNRESSERRVGKLYDTIYSLRDLPEAIVRYEGAD